MSEEKFVVKQYSSDSRPTIKGNGFDGLEVGETREEAEEFALWINHRLAERDEALARCVEFVDKFRTRQFRLREDSAETIDAFLASIPTSAQATAKVLAAARWVPCDEQMPDLVGRDDSHVPGGAPATLYSERVLVFDGTVRIDNLVQAEGSPETRTFYVGSRNPVTHWMPLPEPPEAIREEQAYRSSETS